LKSDLFLRDPVASDYATLTTWIKDAAACARWAGPKLPFPLDRLTLAERLQAPGAISYSMSHGDDNFVGFGQCWPRTDDDRAMHLGRVIVAPGSRRQGFGRALCVLLAQAAIAAIDVKTVSLRVYRDNLSALNIYTSLGFASVADASDDEILFMQADAKILLELEL
jgi:ribosomal-protein-alanine N-acetyltransferase